MHDKFDISDAGADDPVDTLQSILELSHEVLMSYGAMGNTRIQRLARWVIENLAESDGAGDIVLLDDEDRRIGIYIVKQLMPASVRSVASALLHTADEAERVQ